MTVRRPSHDTDPRDICPVCKNAIIMFALNVDKSACSDHQCAAAHGHNPPIPNWRTRSRP